MGSWRKSSITRPTEKSIGVFLLSDNNFTLRKWNVDALFLKFNTRIWKLNYENLFMELIPQNKRAGGNILASRKYYRMNHLSFNATKWLNVGLFDAVTFGRRDHFDFQYIVPVMFLRPAESDIGSADNAIVGLDVKANIKKTIQVYGQLIVDEFKVNEIFKSTGYWANKFGYQIGVKYPNAFGINNLDVQLESNRVRPFTYSHNDSVANYTHYNQPLAHPLGANFSEFIGIARYQPAPKWLMVAKAIYYQQGRDSNNVSFGSNIFLPNIAPYRNMDIGFNIGSGWKTNVTYLSFLLSYELRENMFLEANTIIRRQETKTPPILTQNTSIISFGFRWNMHRREFDF